uniref:C3 and PZP-like alpha-2-macroglobulin domain-containing protein 8 n=1 Tax=Phallusia mammillata TaxID=59560 RepID=A0A6F9D9B9_9ASCI|nr:C3 and PZP-like alpha-2-macroglobulin domain-containing protein 8 [Phallusia mammillata]
MEGKANLKVCGNCHMTSGFRFSNSTPVTVAAKGTSAFIQTDKPVYKPSQTVNVNVFIVDRDLKPVSDNVTAYVVGPNDVRIQQWIGLQPFCCGVVSFSFPLSDQPLLGKWKIFAEVQKHSYNTTFEIQKYVLPKFEVGIKVPPYFREECEEISVSANHVFGKPLQGQLKVNMTVHGVGYSKTRYLDRGPTIVRNMTIFGTALFPICMSQLLPPDVSPYFRGALSIFAEVTAQDGSQFTAYDDTMPVSRQTIDIEYTEDTRAHFKPGIPFKGKIKAHNLDGSGASDVTIILNVAVNREKFYSQELRSNSEGIISFTVPALPTTANVVWLEANVFATSGELSINNITIYKNLHNWFAPSNCHILAQGPGVVANSGGPVKVLVKSSCPCNFTLYYEILSRGNIVQTGSKLVLPEESTRARRKRSPAAFGDSPIPLLTDDNEVVNNEVCQTSLIVDVTPEMAPMSRMVVYYVREDGEGIADSIQLPVKAKLQNKVKISSDYAERRPGDNINIEVTSSPGSCACIALVDRSVHVMKPGYMIGQDQIFDEMQSYDLNNLPYEQGIDWWRLSRSRRSANRWWDISRDAKYAFLESGLVVMTDVIKLDYKMNVQLFPQLLRQSMRQAIRTQEVPPNEARNQRNRVRRRHRTFFPETWIWRCFNVSSGRENFTLQVPDSITTWQADAVSLNPISGIGISRPTSIRAFERFFVDFNLPYSVIRGEQVRIPLTVYNYLQTCIQAEVSVIIPAGVSFNNRGTNRMTRRICIHPQTTETTQVIVEFSYLGNINISATATGVSGVTSCCPGNHRTHKTIGYDAITRSVLVEAEGIHREYTHSVYFCPNERINISTPSTYTFQFVKLPTNVTGFQFLAKARNNVHLILTSQQSASSGSYEVVLGGSRNTRSWISRDSQHLVTAATNHILSDDEFRPFWITWTNGNIQVGTGKTENPESRFMQWREPNDVTREIILYAGFATSDGATGSFRLWKKEESGGSFSEMFQLAIPPNTIPGSQKAVASMIGDVMGPTLSNLNNLLRLPFGCGEQNLANFAPNIYVLRYLQATKQITEDVRSEALHYLQTGYQRQLTYKRRDDSYSAFGDRDSSGSMWLTSFVLKSFSQARDFIYIDPGELHDAKEWIVSWQQENGAFPAVGKIWNKEIHSGVDSDVALTAYVTIAILEAGLEREDEEIAVMKAKEFLESRVHEDTDSYTAALSAYALTLLDSDFAGEALLRLSAKAINESGFSYWSLKVPTDAIFSFADSMKQTVASAEVEMTSYALLTYTHMRNITAALPIVKWLSQKRNAIGGFSSTQDTCVALQSLSEYAIFSYIGGVNLDVHLASTNLDYEREFELNNANSEVMQTAGIPSLPTTMFVTATGDGCALLQIDVNYNIPDPNPQPSFFINVRHSPLERHNQDSAGGGFVINRYHEVVYRIEACARWLHHGSSNMAVLEFNLLSGFAADRESIQQALQTSRSNLKRCEVTDRHVLFYFDEISSTCKTCVRFNIVQIHQVGKAKPQSARIYDYYEPGLLICARGIHQGQS